MLRSHLLGKAGPPKVRDLPSLASGSGNGGPGDIPPPKIKKQRTPTQEAEAQIKKALLKIEIADSLAATLKRAGVCLGFTCCC